MREVNDAVEKFEKDDNVGALVITGSERAFAAGKQPNCIAYDRLQMNFDVIEL